MADATVSAWGVEGQRTVGNDDRVHPDLPPFVFALSLAASFALMLALTVYVFWFAPVSGLTRAVYFTLFASLFYCCIAYLLNRYGASVRNAGFERAPARQLDRLVAQDAPSVTILVPTYREERRVLLMTVISAALARYSQRRIVVLVDDPPGSDSLPDTRATVQEAADLMAEPMAALKGEFIRWQRRRAHGGVDVLGEANRLALCYRSAAGWLSDLAAWLDRQGSPDFAHVDAFVADKVVRDLAVHYHRHARTLTRRLLDISEIDREYLRLSTLFCADIRSFERKQYANLSHAPNKAMNLNAYMSLLGGAHAVVDGPDGPVLVTASPAEADIVAPAPDFVLTLDADSVILSDYILELVDVMERDRGVGVVQTPYLTFPDSTSPVERTAGATTDLQYLSHQGSSHFGAAYWVGANALLRFSALQDIAATRVEDGRIETTFIQDTTVIEDTGSTIDLLEQGWRVHNYPRQLAYSATPADFGSLAVQRQRWSNGGLIIFPMLLRQFLALPDRLSRVPELLLRSHYLLSPAIGNTAVFLLMMMIGTDARSMAAAPLAMLPYFIVYGLDLKRSGYRFGDLFAVSSLNLMLMPVNFAGVIASIRQIATGRKGAFTRTPKVAGRTGVRPWHILFNLGMFTLMGWYVVSGILAEDLVASLVPGITMLLYGYGLVRFIGVVDGTLDLTAGMGRFAGRLLARTWRPVLTGMVVMFALAAPIYWLSSHAKDEPPVVAAVVPQQTVDFESVWAFGQPAKASFEVSR